MKGLLEEGKTEELPGILPETTEGERKGDFGGQPPFSARSDKQWEKKKRKKPFWQHPVKRTIALAAILLVVALVVFPPLFQPGYTPASSEPFDTVSSDVQAAQSDLISVNTATAAELTVLPGIGEVTAAAIVDYRTQNGPFTVPEDLLEVKGIGEKTLENIRDLIVLS